MAARRKAWLGLDRGAWLWWGRPGKEGSSLRARGVAFPGRWRGFPWGHRSLSWRHRHFTTPRSEAALRKQQLNSHAGGLQGVLTCVSEVVLSGLKAVLWKDG